MEFKYMLVGKEFYGNLVKFEQKVEEEGENEERAFSRMATMDKQGRRDTAKAKEEPSTTWYCDKFDTLVNQDRENIDLNLNLRSLNRGQEFKIPTQRSLVVEFMKVLSLAHQCEPESFVDHDGNKRRFYNGPSPDEVALVEFASSQSFECLQSDDSIIRMQAPSLNMVYPKMDEDQMSSSRQALVFEVIRKMEFTSDRKRMSVLLRDPTDGKLKLLVKGADSIINERIDQASIDAEVTKRTEWFLDVASRQGLRTLLMAMKVVDEAEKDEFLRKCQEAENDIANRDAKLETVYSAFERNLSLIGATAVEDRL